MAEFEIIKEYESLLPNLKIKVVDGSGASGTTYDTDMDATNGAGAEFKEIFDAYAVVDATGVKAQCSWSASTGVVTIGDIGAAVQFKLFIVGK